jgi:hypothetical protein
MAGIFRLFGNFSRISLYVILAANCLAGGFTAFSIHQVGLKYFSSKVALFSAWMWAIFPPIAVTDITLSGYAFASLAVVLWLKFIPTLAPKTSNWILLGIAVGFMLLLNPMLVLLIPAGALWLNKKEVLVVSATALLCLAPWYVRNYRALGQFYPALRDNLGMELATTGRVIRPMEATCQKRGKPGSLNFVGEMQLPTSNQPPQIFSCAARSASPDSGSLHGRSCMSFC